MMLSVVFSSMQTLFVRILHTHYSSFELAFSRGFVQLVLSFLWILFTPKLSFWGPPSSRIWLVLRGLAGFIGMSCLYYSLHLLPLGDTTVIFFTAPLITAILAALLLKEPISVYEICAGILCLFGVFLMTNPFHKQHLNIIIQTNDRFLGVCSGLCAALAVAIAYILVRKMGASVDFKVNVFYFALISTLLSPIGMKLSGSNFNIHSLLPQKTFEWIVLFGIGTVGFIGNALLTLGLQQCEAGPATLMRFLEVPSSFILGIIFLHEIPNTVTILGAIIITTTTSSIPLRKWMNSR